MTERRVLLVDDDPDTRELFSFVLKRAGADVIVASDGESALEAASRTHPDLVITDIAMPEMNGLDMILELTRYFLDAKVIAISGEGGEKNVLDVAKLLGARRTMRKPFSMLQLLDAVRYELEH